MHMFMCCKAVEYSWWTHLVCKNPYAWNCVCMICWNLMFNGLIYQHCELLATVSNKICQGNLSSGPQDHNFYSIASYMASMQSAEQFKIIWRISCMLATSYTSISLTKSSQYTLGLTMPIKGPCIYICRLCLLCMTYIAIYYSFSAQLAKLVANWNWW